MQLNFSYQVFQNHDETLSIEHILVEQKTLQLDCTQQDPIMVNVQNIW